MTWITCRLYGKAIERAASRARLTSSGPMRRPARPRSPDSSSSRPTRARTFVVPTSTPTKMTSSEPIIALRSLLTVIRRRRVFHAHQLRNDPPLGQDFGDLPVQLHFEDHVPAPA